MIDQFGYSLDPDRRAILPICSCTFLESVASEGYVGLCSYMHAAIYAFCGLITGQYMSLIPTREGIDVMDDRT